MAEKSYLDKIKEYFRRSGTIYPPSTTEEVEIFEEIMDKDKVFNYDELDLNELAKVVSAAQAEDIRSLQKFYIDKAKDLGIEYTGKLHEVDKTTTENSINLVDEFKAITSIVEDTRIDIRLKFDGDKLAYGKFNMDDDTVTVLAGSDIKEKYNKELSTVRNKRLKYGMFIRGTKLTRDIDGLSPSAAAVLVTGNASNGWIHWTDYNGTPIDKLRENGYSVTDANYAEENDTEEVMENIEKAAENVVQQASIEKDKEQIGIEGGEDMTPEEMLVKGLIGILSGSKSATIEIGDDTIKKLGYKMGEVMSCNDIEKDEYKWQDIPVKVEDFNEQVYGYSLDECISKLELKKALLIMGVPGTGKTTILKHLLTNLTGGDKNRYEIISFSQSTDYTDFIGGLTCINGKWVYKDGVLTEICKLADSNRKENYYLGIDELSRGNTEAIFGELMTGIEQRDTMIKLKNGRKMRIPSNLYIVGTMNTLDNSTKKLDTATRQRFSKYYITPQWGKGYAKWLCNKSDAEDGVEQILATVGEAMIGINQIIKKDSLLGEDKMIGTRAISGIELTMENVKIAIKSQLLPEVIESIKNCDDNDTTLKDYLDDIKGAVN